MEALFAKRHWYWPWRLPKVNFKQVLRGVLYALFVGPRLRRELEPGRFEEVTRLEYPIKL